jgi:hypothetical protein
MAARFGRILFESRIDCTWLCDHQAATLGLPSCGNWRAGEACASPSDMTSLRFGTWALRGVSWLALAAGSAGMSGCEDDSRASDGGLNDGSAGDAGTLRECSVKGHRSSLDPDAYAPAAVPQGTCDDEPACSLRVHDLCPGTDYPGPNQLWRCSCDQKRWRCEITESSKTACLTDAGPEAGSSPSPAEPDTDAGSDDDAGP